MVGSLKAHLIISMLSQSIPLGEELKMLNNSKFLPLCLDLNAAAISQIIRSSVHFLIFVDCLKNLFLDKGLAYENRFLLICTPDHLCRDHCFCQKPGHWNVPLFLPSGRWSCLYPCPLLPDIKILILKKCIRIWLQHSDFTAILSLDVLN